jgi:hypothetical protein
MRDTVIQRERPGMQERVEASARAGEAPSRQHDSAGGEQFPASPGRCRKRSKHMIPRREAYLAIGRELAEFRGALGNAGGEGSLLELHTRERRDYSHRQRLQPTAVQFHAAKIRWQRD